MVDWGSGMGGHLLHHLQALAGMFGSIVHQICTGAQEHSGGTTAGAHTSGGTTAGAHTSGASPLTGMELLHQSQLIAHFAFAFNAYVPGGSSMEGVGVGLAAGGSGMGGIGAWAAG